VPSARPPGESGGRVVVEVRGTASGSAGAGSVVDVTEAGDMDELRAETRVEFAAGLRVITDMLTRTERDDPPLS
jgi:hypothetical protein